MLDRIFFDLILSHLFPQVVRLQLVLSANGNMPINNNYYTNITVILSEYELFKPLISKNEAAFLSTPLFCRFSEWTMI